MPNQPPKIWYTSSFVWKQNIFHFKVTLTELLWAFLKNYLFSFFSIFLFGKYFTTFCEKEFCSVHL